MEERSDPAGAPGTGARQEGPQKPVGAPATASAPADVCKRCALETVARRRGVEADALLEGMASQIARDRDLLATLADALERDGDGGRRFGKLLRRLYAAVAHQLDGVEAHPAEATAGERDARTINVLAKTMETLKGLERDAAGGAGGKKDVDLASMRAEIAERLDRLGEAG